ncbi:MAG: glycosyltransferase family 4 protein [Nitrospirota bacterium]
MKILFVNNFRSRGGGEEFLRELLPGLLRKGIQIGLICRPNTPLVEMFKNSEVKLHPIQRSGLHAVDAVFKTVKVIRDGGYEIVNIQRSHDIIQGWLAAMISGRKPSVMYTVQVPEFLRSRFLLRRMDGIATISRYIRDRLTAFDPALAPRISIVHYGIDLDKFKPAAVPRGWLRNRFGLPHEAKIIGTVGDLWKNQIEFLDVLAMLRKQFPHVYYAIVGLPKQNELLRDFNTRMQTLGLTDAVLWPGRLEKDDMLSFYADLDLAVSTYRNEGFGIWILEAMAMGRPVVSFNAGGIRDSLEGSPAGTLVDGEAKEMAACIAGLLQDDQRRSAMAIAGPQWVYDRFDRQRMIDDYVRYFSSLVK